MAAVYCAAFPESLAHFFPGRPAPLRALADVLAIPLTAEPEAAFVAERDGRVVGYCLAPAHFSRLAPAGRRQVGRLLWRWLSGQYGLGLRTLRVLAADKLQTRRQHTTDRYAAEAHILSIAVHPDCQGQGLGKALLEAGLHYLDTVPASPVRLEVRPHNTAARRLYEQHGFEQVGRTADSQGEWLVMLRRAAAGGGP